jgi:glycerol kinase
MKFIAAIDQGTTSTRCILFDRTSIVRVAQKEHRQIFPKPGWVEHDSLEIWLRTQEVLRDATDGIDAKQIVGIGITNQRETSVVWNRHTGKPYCNAIVWQDTRTKQICDELAAHRSDGRASVDGIDRFRSITGLPLATYFSGPKLRWMLDNVPHLRTDAEKGDALFGTIDAFLVWNLTGRHVTDVTNASRTMLMNLATLDWDDSMLRSFAIPRAMLPKIVPSSDSSAFGEVIHDGLPLRGVPICGVLGDQQAALVGQTCFNPGESKNTYGTGCFLLLNTGEKIIQSRCGLLTTVAYQRAGDRATYALEGSIAVTGSLVQWLRDNLGIIKASADVETLAAKVPDSGGVYFVPAFSGLFAPYWRSDARGTIIGMTRFTNASHIARAALEATAFQTRDVIDAMTRDCGVPISLLKVDGGMSVNELLMQFQSDLLGVPVVRPKITETTALGAAYAAGLAVGFWKDQDELRANWVEDKRWEPEMSASDCDARYSTWKRAVERSMGWVV